MPLHTLLCEWFQEKEKLVDSTANPPYLPGCSSEWTDVSHFDHGRCKIRAEFCRIPAVFWDNAVCGASTEKFLIWLQETLLLHQVLEVIVVKRIGCDQIEWSQSWVATNKWTTPLASASEPSIDIIVTVYPITECKALSLS